MIKIIDQRTFQAIRDKENNRLILSVLCELTYDDNFKELYSDENAQNIFILEELINQLKKPII